MSAIVVVTTVGTEDQANMIACELVSRRLAACVNTLPRVRSTYRWQGKVCTDDELMLVVKTDSDEFETVAATIRELHNYDLPEILAFPVAHGDPEFLAWITSAMDKDADFDDNEEEDEEV